MARKSTKVKKSGKVHEEITITSVEEATTQPINVDCPLLTYGITFKEILALPYTSPWERIGLSKTNFVEWLDFHKQQGKITVADDVVRVCDDMVFHKEDGKVVRVTLRNGVDSKDVLPENLFFIDTADGSEVLDLINEI